MIYKVLHLLYSFLSSLFQIINSVFTSPFRSKIKVTFNANSSSSAPPVTVIAEKLIAEGGFSYIYLAHDIQNPSKQYALKRIICPDDEIMVQCKSEAKVHYTLGQHHLNILPLYGIQFINNHRTSSTSSLNDSTACYMLFPYISNGTLRDEIQRRNLLSSSSNVYSRPFTELEILQIFKGILHGVLAFHQIGLAHCDIKLENILLDIYNDRNNTNSSHTRNIDDNDDDYYNQSSRGSIGTPILMDFGSARKLVTPLSNRQVVLSLTEEAARNSTISYRAPELFEGGCRHGPNEAPIDGKVDVWSCGCVLYGMMFGTSPFEMEFRQDGQIRIVECTYLRVLGGKIPLPPKHTDVGKRYSEEIIDFCQWILNVERTVRPSLSDVIDKVDKMILSKRTFNNRREQIV
jgi:serine/threonine kinase 16